MRATMKCELLFGLITVSSVNFVLAGDWPQWRGPSRDGQPAAGSPAVSSLPRELKPVWRLPVGPGFSSPVVARGKVFFLDEQEGQEVAHCVEAGTAKEVWKTPVATAAGDEWGTGPRSTPFVDGDRGYFQSMNGEFRCLDLADGKTKWGVSFKDYGIGFSTKAAEGTAARRGNNGSGIAEGNYVYVPVGAKGASVVCFDKLTGKLLWEAALPYSADATPITYQIDGRQYVTIFASGGKERGGSRGAVYVSFALPEKQDPLVKPSRAQRN